MKKFTSILLSICLIASCFSMPAGAFEDVEDTTTWYYEAVSYMRDTEIVQGYSDGEMRPMNSMYRCDVVVAVSRCVENFEAPEMEQVFTDVDDRDYYYEEVQWAYSYGIVSGIGETRFRPLRVIRREEAVKMIYQCVKASGQDMETTPSDKQFADRDTVSPWAVESMNWAIDSGIINGDNAGRLNPQKGVTRAEVCMMLYNARDILVGIEMPGLEEP